MKSFWVYIKSRMKPVMSNWLFKHDLNAETISQYLDMFESNYVSKYWEFMIKNEVMLGLYKIKISKPVMSNWLFKHDLNAETISRFGYVWVKLRPKYLEFMIKNEVMLGLYKIKKANRLCLIDYLNTI